MSESFSIAKTGNYEARTKGRAVPFLLEAGRQLEIWNIREKAQRSLREAAGLNESEHIYSVIILTSSNGVNGCAESVMRWRRQYRISTNPTRIPRHPGVAVLACGEGYSKEDGRDCIAPMRLTVCMRPIKRPNVGSLHVHRSKEVSGAISGSEVLLKNLQPVRQANIRDETSVM